MPKFNLNWLYMIIAMMLLGLYLTNESGTATKNISYDEFQQYVRDGYISKVIGYDDNSVEAYVKPQHVGNVFRQDSSRVGKNPLITTEAPSRESLGNFLQKERDEAHFDGSINYEKKRNYFGAILWQILPFAFLIGFWIFMSRRMSGGGGMGGGGGIFSVGKSKAQLFELSCRSNSFDNSAFVIVRFAVINSTILFFCSVLVRFWFVFGSFLVRFVSVFSEPLNWLMSVVPPRLIATNFSRGMWTVTPPCSTENVGGVRPSALNPVTIFSIPRPHASMNPAR